MLKQNDHAEQKSRTCHRKPKPGDIKGKIEIKDERERRDGPGGN